MCLRWVISALAPQCGRESSHLPKPRLGSRHWELPALQHCERSQGEELHWGISLRCCFSFGPRNHCQWAAARPLCPRGWELFGPARGLGECVFAAIYCLPWGARVVCLRRREATPYPLPSTEGGDKNKVVGFPSENPIMKTCVYWPTIILKPLHLNCNQTAKWPFCSAPPPTPSIPERACCSFGSMKKPSV